MAASQASPSLPFVLPLSPTHGNKQHRNFVLLFLERSVLMLLKNLEWAPRLLGAVAAQPIREFLFRLEMPHTINGRAETFTEKRIYCAVYQRWQTKQNNKLFCFLLQTMHRRQSFKVAVVNHYIGICWMAGIWKLSFFFTKLQNYEQETSSAHNCNTYHQLTYHENALCRAKRIDMSFMYSLSFQWQYS